MTVYRFRLLRYAPNRVAEEFYNLALLLYSGEGRLLDARFAPDFQRLRCHPLADLPYLRELRKEFDERRLAGEAFTGYVTALVENLSQGLQITEERAFLGGEALEEMERLAGVFLATPKRREIAAGAPAEGTRRWVLGRMRHCFEIYHLLGRFDADVEVGSCVSPRFRFHLDYAYKPNGHTHYLQGLSAQHDLNDAGRLCFVFDRLRAHQQVRMTAIVGDALPEDTRELLASSQIRPWPVSKLDELALAVREELGL